MGTSFSEIYDDFMTTVTDYTLITLYNASVSDFETYISAFLIKAIEDFSLKCDQDLSYSSSTFSETLSQKNIDMLALLVKQHWLEKTIDDIKQIS